MRSTLSCLILILMTCLSLAAKRGENLLVNPGMEDGNQGWEPVGDGFAMDRTESHSGHQSMRCDGKTPESTASARQVLTFDPPVHHPFTVSGWSKAENAVVGQDYNIYLDVIYEDGTPLWGQIASFSPGTHDWERAELIFDVAKPIRTIEAYILFRKCQGTVWFDDIEVTLTPFAFRNLRTQPGPFGQGSLSLSGSTTLPASWTAIIEDSAAGQAERSGTEMPIRAQWTDLASRRIAVRVSATDKAMGETMQTTLPVRLGRGASSRPYAIWTESSMVRVLPDARPKKFPKHPQASVSLAGNERESFQVVLLAPPGQGLKDVRVEKSDLVGRDGTISRENIQWHLVGFVRLKEIKGHPAYPEATPGWWPDPLLPVDRFDVAPDMAHSIWLTLYAPPGTPAGSYRGSVTVRPEGMEPTSVQVRAEVMGFDLPIQGHMKTAFALMDGFLETLYGKPLTAELRQKYGDLLLENRLNPDDISRTSPPAMEDLLHYKDRGLNAFNVLNLVEERGDKVWVCWSPVEAYTPVFKAQLIQRLDPVVAELRRTGLIDRAYIYSFDERGKDFDPILQEYFGLIKERYPEIHTLTTAWVQQDPAEMSRLCVDWACPLTPTYNFDRAEACRRTGQQVWAYICLGPGFPYANWLADFPLIEARLIWWQAFQQKMDGFLYWGVNIWGRENNDKVILPEDGPFLSWSITTGGEYDWLHGDGVLLYPGPSGPIGSIRLANIRDGLEDYEVLWLLANEAGDLDEARNACLPVSASLTSFTRDPEVLSRQREAIARRVASSAVER